MAEVHFIQSLSICTLIWEVGGCVNTVSVSLKGKRRRFILIHITTKRLTAIDYIVRCCFETSRNHFSSQKTFFVEKLFCLIRAENHKEYIKSILTLCITFHGQIKCVYYTRN